MADAEQQPLLTVNSRRDSNKERSRTVCTILVILTSFAALGTIVFIAAFIGTGVYLSKFYNYPGEVCQNAPLSLDSHSRSGSYSLMLTIPFKLVDCYEKQIETSLLSVDSMVDIYQTLCEDIEKEQFSANNWFNDLTVNDGEPLPAFDENYSPQNYFLSDGRVQVDIFNATTKSSSPTAVYLCVFTDTDHYHDVLRAAGLNWMNYTENAKCQSQIVEPKASGTSHVTTTFNITMPTFFFLAAVTNGSVHMDLLNVTASGERISALEASATNECQLQGGHTMTCSFDLINYHFYPNSKSLNQTAYNVCIVAHEWDNPDGSYDYSNLTATLTKRHNSFQMSLVGFGIFASTTFVLLVGFVITVGVLLIRRRYRNSPDHILTAAPGSVTVTSGPVQNQCNGDHTSRMLVPGGYMDKVHDQVSHTESSRDRDESHES